MRLELPQLKRCCCCIPLRYGLLVWGYLKLICALFLFYPITKDLIFNIKNYVHFGAPSWATAELLINVLFLLALMVEIILSIVFLVGAHTKNPRLLKSYYFYSIFIIVTTAILFIIRMGHQIYVYRRYLKIVTNWMAFLPVITIGTLNIILQFYLILLLRSEIIKLKNNVNFRFENHASEAACVMSVNFDDVEDAPEIGGDDVIKHVYEKSPPASNNLQQ